MIKAVKAWAIHHLNAYKPALPRLRPRGLHRLGSLGRVIFATGDEHQPIAEHNGNDVDEGAA